MATRRPAHLFAAGDEMPLPRKRREESVHPLDGRKMGEAAHQVIAALVEAGARAPTYSEVLAAVAAHPSSDAPMVYRMSAGQRLIAAATAYFRHFAPPTSWNFLGAEVQTRRTRFDLVWMDENERYWVDELKTGRSVRAAGSPKVLEQAQRHVAAGNEFYGSSFGGVRVCALRAPGRSFTLMPDGSRLATPRPWEQPQ